MGQLDSREFRGGQAKQQTTAPNGFSLFVMKPPLPERVEYVRDGGGGSEGGSLA